MNIKRRVFSTDWWDEIINNTITGWLGALITSDELILTDVEVRLLNCGLYLAGNGTLTANM